MMSAENTSSSPYQSLAAESGAAGAGGAALSVNGGGGASVPVLSSSSAAPPAAASAPAMTRDDTKAPPAAAAAHPHAVPAGAAPLSGDVQPALPPFTLEDKQFMVNNELCSVKLTRHVLTIDFKTYSRSATVRSMVGVSPDRTKQHAFKLHTYAFPDAGCCGGATERVHVPYTFEHPNATVLARFELALRQLIGGWVTPVLDGAAAVPPARRKLLVLVNPFGGKGGAARVCAEVLPVLEHSGAEVVKRETERAGHAHDIGRDLVLGEYDAVVLVSGDGLISEFINGLFSRADWRAAVGSLAIGVIPGGSANGLAKSLLAYAGEPFSALNAAFLVAKGQARKVDIFTVAQTHPPGVTAAQAAAQAGGGSAAVGGAHPYVGFLSLQWAIASDVDFESEKWRACCGGARFTWTAITRLCCLRTYGATVEVLPANVPLHKPNWSTRKVALPEYERCSGSECKLCVPRAAPIAAAAKDEKAPVGGAAPLRFPEADGVQALADYWATQVPVAAAAGAADAKSTAAAPAASVAVASSDAKAPAAASAKSGGDGWVALSGNDSAYAMVWAMNTPYPSYDMFAAPYAHLSDGLMDLIVVRDVGCCSLAPLFLDIESGAHVNDTNAEYIKVRGIRLRPNPANSPQSIVGVDGERLTAAPSEMRCFKGILNVFAK